MNLLILVLLKRHPWLFIILDLLADLALVVLAIMVFRGCYMEYHPPVKTGPGTAYGIDQPSKNNLHK